MEDDWLHTWNTRYRAKSYAYGTTPNQYLKTQLDQLPAGKILFAAEGEGRNAVYAATRGWKVSAFDISIEGKNKAIQLAKANSTHIDYQVGQLTALAYHVGEFDVIALIYAHFPPLIRSKYHRRLGDLLKTGGRIILEAFGKNHLPYRSRNEKVGGPNDQAFLISTDEINVDFKGYKTIELTEKEVELNEGIYHNGVGSVTRFVGVKR
ncbi:MAG: class I SAM-dependent methyltransferase [Bacteroidota bacterium]